MSRAAALAVVLTLALPGDSGSRAEAPTEPAYSSFSPDPARRFDFFIGEWDVNLRVLRDDLTLQDSVSARVSVYPIFGGKAILELWDSALLKRFSLHYYDQEADRWELWLDWLEPNRSYVERLEGGFRHGRGEFHATSTNAEERMITTVHSFSDITPFSLRWDDSYSADGGKNWTRHQVMEFTRTKSEPEWPIRQDAVPTYTEGERCNDEGSFWYGVLPGSWRSDQARMEILPILDGCAVMWFLEHDRGPDEFVFTTFDSVAGNWLALALDDGPETGLVPYVGAHTASDLVATVKQGGSMKWVRIKMERGIPVDRLIYRRDGRELALNRVDDTPVRDR